MAGGNEEFIMTQCALPDDLRAAGRAMADKGITPLYFSLDGHAAGVIGVGRRCEADQQGRGCRDARPWHAGGAADRR